MGSVRVLVASAALLAACGGGASAEGGPGGPPPPAPVDVAQATEGELAMERVYLGIVRSRARARLAAGAEGRVLEVAVREGDRVARGDVLLRIDPGLARASLTAAQASERRTLTEREQASRDAERFAAAGPTAVSRTEIERAATQADALAAQREAARAEVSRARESLDRHRVVAPFAGVIAARTVDPGDWVQSGLVVLELVADADLEVLVRVEPELLDDVAEGHEVSLVRGGRAAPARVAGVVPALDPATRTAQLRLVPSEPIPWLYPGSTTDVRLTIVRGGDGVLVPRDALVPGVGQTRVVRVVDGAAQPAVVEVLELGTDRARVRAEGLAAGDTVVTRGNDRLRPGQAVRVSGE
ncbi:MAG: efflux RND transporter periplasmic adaptor subunit [Sandaracinaceae bacterium]|nr:efflux RND transporter periplasmic adaptor subunit [Sandaracinaceae bacterium]